MKKALVCLLTLGSFSVFAAGPQLDNLSKAEVEKVGNEFAANFAHTTVSAPETEGAWGIEVGVIGGVTASPNLKKIINKSGGEGSDFKNIYHAGIAARAHFPFDIFLEGTILPQRTIQDVKVKNQTFGAGWNLGGFFGLPLDLAVGVSMSNADVNFTQSQAGGVVTDTEVNLNSKTTLAWIGASKTFLFFTPYTKVGFARTQADIDVTGSNSIFNYSASKSESVDRNGAYLTVGANLQLAFIKIGAEATQINTVKMVTGKLSLDF